MNDFRNDPNFVRHEMQAYNPRVQWAAVTVLLLLCAGIIIAAAWSGVDTQTAMNTPAATTGSAPSAPAAPPARR